MEASKTTNQVLDLAIRFGIAIVGAIASVGFVAFVGAVVLWSRFEATQLPADQAVAVQPRADLVTVGAIALVFFVLGGLLAVLVLRLLDQEGTASLRTRNGLIGIATLEVLAALVVEEWEPQDIIELTVASVLAVVGLVILLNSAGWWYDNHTRYYGGAGSAGRKLARRAAEVFVTRRHAQVERPPRTPDPPRPSRVRLWLGILLTGAIVAAVIWKPDWPFLPDFLEGYVAALVPLVLVLALFLVDFVRGGPSRTWSGLVLAVGLFVASVIMFSRESEWVAWIALIAFALGAFNLLIAKVTGQRFVLYGFAVFLSVTVFGAVFQFVRGQEDPQAQGLAFVRIDDDKPRCGLYVGETDDRLYYSRVDLEGKADVRRLRDDSGRLLWVPRDRLRAYELGPLEPVDAAQSTALDLQQEVAHSLEPGKTEVKVPVRQPRSAGGQDPCGPAAEETQRTETPERVLAERFQPRLVLSRHDGFWPISVLTIFDLKRRGEVLCRAPACVPVRSPADLPFVGGQSEWLEYPGDDTDRKQQRRQVVRALGSDDPYRTADEYFLATGGGEGKSTSLQYWFFYPFNYQPLRTGVTTGGHHEGDFEHVGVLLAHDGAPQAVYMARHALESQVYLWDEPVVVRRRDHVQVYVARGSHASYNTCTRQARPLAPHRLIDDRPECEGRDSIVLEPGQVPLWDLSRARWACWGGRFGHSVEGLPGAKYDFFDANGPRSPLWQQGSGAPCEDAKLPQGVLPLGEEPLVGEDGDRHARAVVEGSRRLDTLIDTCDEWRKPQPQGAYVVACDPAGLRDWVSRGLGDFSGAGLQVIATEERPGAARRRPVAVRRFANVRSFDGWRVTSDRDARIVVYASCLARGKGVEATFDVRIRAGETLRVTAPATGAWRLGDGTRSTTATPVEAPLTKRRGEGEPARAQLTDCNR